MALGHIECILKYSLVKVLKQPLIFFLDLIYIFWKDYFTEQF